MLHAVCFFVNEAAIAVRKESKEERNQRKTAQYLCTALQKFGDYAAAINFVGKGKLSLQSAGLMPGFSKLSICLYIYVALKNINNSVCV